MRTAMRFGLGAMAGILLALDAGGQTQRSGNDAARVMQQLQQATAERGKLEQENLGLKKELEALKADQAKVSAEQKRLQQRTRELEAASGRSESTNAADKEALEKTRAQLQELVGKFRETGQSLKEVETDRDRLRAEQASRQRDFQTCVDRNAQFYLLGDELLQRLENRGVWSSLRDQEPFTQLSRTRLENLIDDYRYRLDELRQGDKGVAVAN